MKRRRLILFGALALLAAGVVALWPRGPKEPVYQGKKLTRWVWEANFGADTNQMQEARQAIKVIGTNGLPYLVSELTRPHSELRARLNSIFDRMNWKLHIGDGEAARMNAMHGVALLEADAVPALPVLGPHLGDPDCWAYVAWAMSSCGESSLPYFTNALSSTNFAVRFGGAYGLAGAAFKTKDAIPHLLHVLNGPDIPIRVNVAIYLKHRNGGPELIVPILIENLTNSTPDGLQASIETLGFFGVEAKAAVPELLRLLNGSDPVLSMEASNALYKIDPAALPR